MIFPSFVLPFCPPVRNTVEEVYLPVWFGEKKSILSHVYKVVSFIYKRS